MNTNYMEQRELTERRQCELGDGTWVSVQANEFVYCVPRTDNAESYRAVEAWFYRKDKRFGTGRRDLTKEPLAYLPATKLMEMIESHGGLVSGELPPLNLGNEEE
jgi:hypothetical protein